MENAIQLQDSVVVRHADGADNSSFEGVITSTSLTSYYNHFSEKSLKRMTRQANAGVPVLAEHGQRAQPIGRSTSAVYNEDTEEVISEFYIQRGLNLRSGFDGGGYADTDSYADALSAGTARNLSIGAIIKDETCDRCQAKMRRFSFFGMVFASCENGHHPGQTLYIDEDDKEHHEPKKGRRKFTVTSTINDASLEEFSVVAFAANPDAKVMREIQSAFEKGEIKPYILDQMATNYSIQQFGGTLKYVGDNNSPDGGGTTMSDQIVDGMVSQDLYDGVKSQNLEFQKEIDELNKELAELRGSEETHTATSNALTAANKRITELEKELSDLDSSKAKVIAYDAECARARDRALAQFNRSRGLQLLPGEEEEERQKLSKITDLNQIREWEDIHRKKARLKEGSPLQSGNQNQSGYISDAHAFARNQPNFNVMDYA